MNDLPKTKGSYILVSELMCEVQLDVGALVSTNFSPGLYLYCGSARGPGGLSARISHHLRLSPRPTWHFDYLKPYAAIKEIWLLESSEPYECRLAEMLAMMKGANQPVRGFGSQDCQSSCYSHLVRFPLEISIKSVFQHVKEANVGLIRTNVCGALLNH